jgi:PAS domain S-box-containing protein
MDSLFNTVRAFFLQPLREPTHLQAWREQTLRLLSTVLLIVFVPLLLVHTYGSLQRQEHLKLGFELLLCAFAVGAGFVSRIPYNLRVCGAVCSWYLLGVETTLTTGLVGAGRAIFCVAVILAALLLNHRAAIVAWAVAMLLLLLSLGGHALGFGQPPALIAAKSTDLNIMLTNSLVVVAITSVTLSTLLALMSRLTESLRIAEEANATLGMMLRMLPDLVWFKEADGRYKFASDVFFEFHKRSPTEVIGRTATDLFPPSRTVGMARGDAHVIEKGERYYQEALVPTLEGREVWLDTIKTPVYDDDGRLVGILGTSHDITARKQAEEGLARQARYAQALARSAQLLLARGESQWDRVCEALEQLRAAVDVSRCFVHGFHSVPGVPSSLVADRQERGRPVYLGRQLGLDDLPPEMRAALLERRWFGGPTAGRWPDYPQIQELYDRFGIQSTLTVPLFVDGKLWGHMGFADRSTPREWDEATIQLVSTAAELIAASIAAWEDARVLRERTEAAEAADRAKSAFMATMSHEIRTPLNAVIGTTELLAETRLSGEQRALADLIRGGGEALLETVNSILDFSKIEAGRIDLELRPFDLYACLDEALGMVARSAAQKGIALELRHNSVVPRYLLGDVTRLRRVLINLLANAVKFTERGAVVLEVSRAESASVDTAERVELPMGEQRELRVQFRVCDTGIGIAPERLSEIFEPFTQADSSTTRRYGGTGLGLAICRQLVALMGGQIDVSSKVGLGSTFTVLLSLAVAEPERWQEASPARALQASLARPLRILVAEDNSVNQDVTRMMLVRLGYRAEIVADGAAAVAAVVGNSFDLVLMDVQMPVLDGLEATRRIRAFGSAIHQPRIVALTANALKGDRERYLVAGMDDYIGKPVHLSTLQATLGALIGAAPSTAGVASNTTERKLIDHEALAAQLDVLGGGERARSLVLRLLSQEIARQIDGLAVAASAGDREALAASAHKLRGGCGQLGACGLAERCARLEREASTSTVEELMRQVLELRDCHDATLELMRQTEALTPTVEVRAEQ